MKVYNKDFNNQLEGCITGLSDIIKLMRDYGLKFGTYPKNAFVSKKEALYIENDVFEGTFDWDCVDKNPGRTMLLGMMLYPESMSQNTEILRLLK